MHLRSQADLLTLTACVADVCLSLQVRLTNTLPFPPFLALTIRPPSPLVLLPSPPGESLITRNGNAPPSLMR